MPESGLDSLIRAEFADSVICAGTRMETSGARSAGPTPTALPGAKSEHT